MVHGAWRRWRPRGPVVSHESGGDGGARRGDVCTWVGEAERGGTATQATAQERRQNFTNKTTQQPNGRTQQTETHTTVNASLESNVNQATQRTQGLP